MTSNPKLTLKLTLPSSSQSPPTSQSSQGLKLNLGGSSQSSQSSQGGGLKLKLSQPSQSHVPIKLSMPGGAKTASIGAVSRGGKSYYSDKKVDCEDMGNGTYKINGYCVKFPYMPYDCQASMISKILESLDNSTHCVLESSTGTGKTLSLLTSTLEWQMQHDAKREAASAKNNAVEEKRKKEMIDNLQADDNPSKRIKVEGAKGSGKSTALGEFEVVKSEYDDDDHFKLQSDIILPKKRTITTTTTTTSTSPTTTRKRKNMDDRSPKKEEGGLESDLPEPSIPSPPKIPKSTIFYCTRTHSQIKQLTSELRKTPYRPNMVILGSRDHYCVNPSLKDVSKKKEKCMKLVKEGDCSYVKKQKYTLASSLSKFKRTGEKNVWDIEDLMAAGKETRECPFYASKDMVEDADIVFCPYNYLIDPSIRKGIKSKIANSIVIFDEAHNIEDAFMDAASFEYSVDDIMESYQMINDNLKDSKFFRNAKADEKEMAALLATRLTLERMISWIKSKESSLKNVDFEKASYIISDSRQILEALQLGMGINQQNYGTIESNLNILSEEGRDQKPNSDQPVVELIHPKTIVLLEAFCKVLTFLFRRDSYYAKDYRVAIQRKSVTGGHRGGSRWSDSLSIWAMSPRVAFNSLLNDNVRSVILTSGTLSPLGSFQYELSAPFPIMAELGNLSDIQSRVWIGTLGYAGQNDSVKLDGRMKESDSLVYQDALADAILKHLQEIPHGVLVFFPSYGFMDKMIKRWSAGSNSTFDKMRRVKPVFVEPKVGKEFKETLKDYYNTIKNGLANGAVLFAVCRGKISEGIDFADQYARGVIIVGIPYPSLGDIRVSLKKEYNDQSLSPDKRGISGSYWYNLQAYRALNQAIGRCIRHKNDYGSILLIDERFTQSNTCDNLSKWARHCIKNLKNTKSTIPSLKEFFETKKNQELNKAS